MCLIMGCLNSTTNSQKDLSDIDKGLADHKDYNARLSKVRNDVPQSDVNVNVASVTLMALRETAYDGDKTNSLIYQTNMLKSSDSMNTGSSLSLSDIETYRKKKFPKWRGYRKCKYCTQIESLPSSFKSSSDSLGGVVRKEEIPKEKEPVMTNAKTKRKKNKKETVPRGLPSRDSCRNCSTKLTKSEPVKNNNRNNFNADSNSSRYINLLAMNALDLTAPASDALLKSRKNAWVQLAGHPGAFAPAGPDTIWKKRLTKDNSEVKAYQALMNDASKDVVPTFYREVEFNGDFFIEMEDLLHHFHDPYIMDIKMGCRTFLEAEVKNPVMRKDLYEKMIRLDPEAPTKEEHAERAITKLRYMQFREEESSTANLGFRLEAIRITGQTPVTDLKKVKTKEEVGAVIGKFISCSEKIRVSILNRLIKLRQCFENSEFFKTHELIGSSLLVMFDNDGNTGVWMIDFAKTLPVEKPLTHRDPWIVGNHEDGYLTGLDHLIQVFQNLSVSCQNHNEIQSQESDQSTSNDIT